MTVFDYAVFGILAASTLLGVWRGVVSEILALAAWVAAFLLARAEAATVAGWLTGQIVQPELRLAAAYGIVFVGVLIVFAIGRMILSLVLKAVGLGTLDRLLGAGFGVLRGMLVVIAVVMVAGMTPLPKAEWWRNASLSPPLETVVLALKPWVPAEVAKRIRFR